MSSQFVQLPKVSGGTAATVDSLNGLTGSVSLTAGSNITLTPSGNSIQIASTGGSIIPIGSVRPPSPSAGQQFYDKNINKPIWYTGSAWVDATGNAV